MTDGAPKKHRFVDAMPRPVLALFAVSGLGALAVAAVLLLRPPVESVALQDRRPPPRGSHTHDAGTIAPAPLPSVVPTLPPACPELAGVRLAAGGDGVVRLHEVLRDACALSRGGVAPELGEAVRGLRDATLRFAGFDRTGVESTLDLDTRTIWLNIKLARRAVPTPEIVPIVVHEALHLARARVPTAETELAARRAEVAACRELIPIERWPRWCRDARALTSMPLARALDLLVSAGYER